MAVQDTMHGFIDLSEQGWWWHKQANYSLVRHVNRSMSWVHCSASHPQHTPTRISDTIMRVNSCTSGSHSSNLDAVHGAVVAVGHINGVRTIVDEQRVWHPHAALRGVRIAITRLFTDALVHDSLTLNAAWSRMRFCERLTSLSRLCIAGGMLGLRVGHSSTNLYARARLPGISSAYQC